MTKSYEQDVAAAETYSHSSREDGEYDDAESIFDDEEEEQPFWRQHFPAILIAFAAAVAGHVYNQQQGSSSSLFLFQPNQSTIRHPHVEQYVRTANISFCQSLPAATNQHLKQMEFFIPQGHFDTLQNFYQADESQDDMYEELHYKTLPSDPDFQCLQEQQRTASSSTVKLKGTSYHYKVSVANWIRNRIAGLA